MESIDRYRLFVFPAGYIFLAIVGIRPLEQPVWEPPFRFLAFGKLEDVLDGLMASIAPQLGLCALLRFSHYISLPLDEIIMAQFGNKFVSNTSDEALESGGHIIDGLRFPAFFFFPLRPKLEGISQPLSGSWCTILAL